MALLLAAFAIFLAATDQSGELLLSLLAATGLSILVEAIILYVKTKKPAISESAVITGLILGFVLTPDQDNWFGLYAFAAFAAIASKYIIRFKNKHIFNPAAFGVILGMLIFKTQTAWAGTYYWYLLLPAGLYLAYRMRKIELLLSYGITALGIFAIQALAQGHDLKHIFGYLSYFFICIMLIEPKTSPVAPKAKIVFGIIAAVAISFLTLSVHILMQNQWVMCQYRGAIFV